MTEVLNNFELSSKRQEVAKRQVWVTDSLVNLYKKHDIDDTAFAGVLDNPIIYANGENIEHLPNGLKEHWDNLGLLCAYFVVNAASETRTDSWADPIQSVRDIIESGVSDPLARGDISEITQLASGIFAESIKYRAGNTRRFEMNVEKLEKLIPIE